jgi:hypothetical protein
MVILTLGMKLLPSTLCTTKATPPSHAKKRLEKVAIGRCLIRAESATAVLKTRAPVWWWIEILTRLPVGSQLIIGRSFFGIFQHIIGFTQFFKFFISLR